jgi:hypothetical protein
MLWRRRRRPWHLHSKGRFKGKTSVAHFALPTSL